MVREYVKSICALVWGVVSRFYFALPAVLFDPKDIYSETLKNTPPEWESLHAVAQFLAGVFDLIPPDAFWWVLALTALWALVCTYHEARTSANSSAPLGPDVSARWLFRHLLVDSKWSLGRGVQLGTDADEKRTGGELYKAVQGALRDAARLGALQVWARKRGDMGMRYPLEEIDKDRWENIQFDLMTCMGVEESATANEWLSVRPDILEDVMINRQQALRLWPKATWLERCRDKTRHDRLAFFLKESSEEMHVAW